MALSVTGLVKAYGAKPVLHGLDLTVEDGEIHALLGPNGSGKSTLIRCLSGAARPDAGAIVVGEMPLRDYTPRESIEAGISVIYQHFSLVPPLTVADNVFLGDELRVGPRVDQVTQEREASRLLEQFGRPIRANRPVSDLSIGDRQLVEIAKALRRKPKVLILDEPTAALGEREAEQLGFHLRRLRGEGLAILYVTHLLGEVFAIADRVTVLRDGRIVLADRVSGLEPGDLIEAISPASVRQSADVDDAATLADGRAAAASLQPAVLELEEVVVEGIGPASLSVRPGEVVGLFGLLGSGRTELLEGIFGHRPLTGGSLRMSGKPFRSVSPAVALGAGIVLVAGDRIRQSIFDKLSTRDNMLLPHVGRMSRWLVRSRKAELAAFTRVARDVRLKPNDPDIRAWALSGGNQQKLAVGRWLVAQDSLRVLLLDEPTQGIDIGARRDLYELVRRLARTEGKAVLFTSSDPEETLSLADRVLVLRRGRIVGELERGAFTERDLLSLAHGAEAIRGGAAGGARKSKVQQSELQQ